MSQLNFHLLSLDDLIDDQDKEDPQDPEDPHMDRWEEQLVPRTKGQDNIDCHERHEQERGHHPQAVVTWKNKKLSKWGHKSGRSD